MLLQDRTTKKEKGFTLIEVIAVLIILSILVVMAVPKYVDLMEKARERALEGALADGMSTVSMNYAYLMLSNGGTAATNDLATRAQAYAPESGDFSYVFTPAETGVEVKVVAISTGSLGDYSGEKTKTWIKP